MRPRGLSLWPPRPLSLSFARAAVCCAALCSAVVRSEEVVAVCDDGAARDV